MYMLKLFINYFKKICRNPMRMGLTLSGLVVSVIVLESGFVFSETFLQSKTKMIDIYKQKSMIEIKTGFDSELYGMLENIGERTTVELRSGAIYNVGNVKIKDKNVNVYISDIRTDLVNLDFQEDSLDEQKRYSSNIVEGRLITKKDIEGKKNVVVIKDTLAKLLFKGRAVGHTIDIPLYVTDEKTQTISLGGIQRLTVIGVIADNKKIDDYINSKNVDGNIIIPAYVPLSFEIKNENVDDYNMRMLIRYKKGKYKDGVNEVRSILFSNTRSSFEERDYYNQLDETQEEINIIKRVLFVIVILMFIVSGIGIMNTMFFSIKERINEIGIRKSIGADNTDIMLQFIFEGVVYGIIGSFVGLFFTVNIDSIIFLLLNILDVWKAEIGLCISLRSVIVTFGSSISICIVSSIIPAVYASKIKIAEAIRYD